MNLNIGAIINQVSQSSNKVFQTSNQNNGSNINVNFSNVNVNNNQSAVVVNLFNEFENADEDESYSQEITVI